MGTQQFLLLVLVVVIVGIAIAVGITMFGSESIASSKDGLVEDLNNLAANGYQYRLRPAAIGGGNGSYVGYIIPQRLEQNANGSYSITSISPESITIVAIAAHNAANSITAVLDSAGALTSFTYAGDF